jgi:glycosyltransferase involved in cell wall biosynthesis
MEPRRPPSVKDNGTRSVLARYPVTSDPRILFVDQTGKLGGAELCLADLAVHLRNRCMVFLFERGPFQELLEENGVDVAVVGGQLGGSLALPLSVRKNSKASAYLLTVPAFIWLVVSLSRFARKFDLLYANTAKALVVTAITALLLRKPFLVHLHDMIDTRHFSRFNRWLLVTAANFATGIVANSKATAEAYRKAGGRNRNLVVVPNGFQVERFRADVESLGREIRASIASRDRPLVGMFGRITAWKGQKILMQALARLPGMIAIIVGDSLFTVEDQQYKFELIELAERLGVSDRVHFVGFQTDILPFLNAVDLVVHCSISPEPFGRVIVEALLAGKPVVATRGGGPEEIIEDQKTGILVDPDDPVELAKAIERLLTDRAWAKQLAAAGRKSVEERFSLDRVLEEWTDFIDKSVRDRAPNSGLKTAKNLAPNSVRKHEVKLTGA